MIRRLSLAAALALLVFPAFAQEAKVVATCGTAPATYPIGAILPIQMDQNGNLCITATSGGGGGAAVTQGTTPWVVSAASLPLPSGAATSALQSTINTTLGSPMQTTGGTVGLVAGTAVVGTVGLYAAPASMVRGTTTSTDTGAHTIIASAGGSLKNYITGIQCYRTDTGTGAIVLTFSDSASTVMILPAAGANFAGSGAIQANVVPLATAAATAFTVTSGTGTSTVYCNAQGYTGT